ncbi:MAG: HAMP domain-containing methyl-accepting chemotaxis protein [Fretibacterium sp.]|nr:HAMP domain-containing methyl-accepting chemotaxis protein [Fretibacterium sp.]
MLKNLKISGKLYVGFSLVLMLFGVAVFISWLSISAVQKDISFLGQILRSLGMANNTNSTVSFIRAGIRDLHFSESDEDAAKLRDYLAELKTKADSMKKLYAEQPKIDTLARASDLEAAHRDINENLEKFVETVNVKNDAAHKLDEGFIVLQKLFTEIVELQYKRAYDEHHDINDGIEKNEDINKISELTHDLDRKLDRVKGAEDMLTRLLVIAWDYKAAMEALDADKLAAVAHQIEELQKMTKEFADTTKVQLVRDKLNALNGEFELFKTGFAQVIKGFTESEPLFQRLLEDGMEMVNVSDVIVDTGITRSVEYIDRNGKALGNSVLLLIILAAVAVVVGLGIAFFIARIISKPLGRVVMLTHNARDGDISITRDDFEYEGHDELGSLGDALSEMFDSLRTAISDIRENADASTEKAETMREDAGKNLDGANNVRKAVNEAVKLMESNSSSLQQSNAGTEEMSAASMTSAQAATDCAEFIANVTHVANEATATVQEAIANMGILQKKTEESGEKLQGLVDSVDKISEFISVITSIADQTNLLALNAAIEAARAGEAGRGFAVVAESVRKLAEESSRAAENVRGLMGALQDGAQDTKAASEETAMLLVQTVEKSNGAKESLTEAMSQIDKANDRIQNIAAVAQEQAASSREIAGGIDNVTKSTAEILENLENIKVAMDDTALVAERATSIANEQAQLAEDLRDSLAMFKVESEESLLTQGPKALPAKE